MFLFVITKVIIALLAFIILLSGLFITLRVFDSLLGVDFKLSFSKISTCPKAMSLYYGLRWLGTSITLGVIVCVAFIM